MASTWKLKKAGKGNGKKKHLYYCFESCINWGIQIMWKLYVCRVWDQKLNHVARMKTSNESENILIRYVRQFTKDPN